MLPPLLHCQQEENLPNCYFHSNRSRIATSLELLPEEVCTLLMNHQPELVASDVPVFERWCSSVDIRECSSTLITSEGYDNGENNGLCK